MTSYTKYCSMEVIVILSTSLSYQLSSSFMNDIRSKVKQKKHEKSIIKCCPQKGFFLMYLTNLKTECNKFVKISFFKESIFLVRFRYFWISEKMKCFETDGLFFSPIWNKPICNNPIFLHSRLIVFIMHHIGARYNIFLSFFLSFLFSVF